jgi:hypothetical protein
MAKKVIFIYKAYIRSIAIYTNLSFAFFIAY